jgi:hypothetical protein
MLLRRPQDLRQRGRHRLFFAAVLRLRPVLIRASRVLPSTPPLFHRVERHCFDGQFGGFSVSGIHLCPQTSHTATRIVFQPMQPLYRILSAGHIILDWQVGNPYTMSNGQNTIGSPKSSHLCARE